MSEEKKKVATLDQNKMEDIKGGIPYDDPGLIALDDPALSGDPAASGDDVVTSECTAGNYNSTGSCMDGNYNRTGGSCFNGLKNVGACGDGASVDMPI